MINNVDIDYTEIRCILVGLALSENMGDVNDELPRLAEELDLPTPVWSDRHSRFVFPWEGEERDSDAW